MASAQANRAGWDLAHRRLENRPARYDPEVEAAKAADRLEDADEGTHRFGFWSGYRARMERAQKSRSVTP